MHLKSLTEITSNFMKHLNRIFLKHNLQQKNMQYYKNTHILLKKNDHK